MNKKAYIFIIDGIIAVFILATGFLLLTSQKPQESLEMPLSLVLDNGMSLLSNIKIEDVCDNGCSCENPALSSLCAGQRLTNNRSTLLDAFGELYYKSTLGSGNPAYLTNATKLFENLTAQHDLFRHEVTHIELQIDGHVIYTDSAGADTKTRSDHLISGKRIIFGYYENPANGEVRFWGPYIAEVEVWE